MKTYANVICMVWCAIAGGTAGVSCSLFPDWSIRFRHAPAAANEGRCDTMEILMFLRSKLRTRPISAAVFCCEFLFVAFTILLCFLLCVLAFSKHG